MIDLTIRTERLTLRPFAIADAPRVRELTGAWAVTRMLARVPFPYPIGLAEDWIGKHAAGRAAAEAFPFAVTLHNRLIGCVDLNKKLEHGRMELGYWIAAPFWGLGYATEAAGAILSFGFGWLGTQFVGASHYEENESSGRVLAKLGFVETGRGMHPCLARNTELPGVQLELTRDAWMGKQV